MVMGRGEIRGFFDRASFDREALMSAALTGGRLTTERIE